MHSISKEELKKVLLNLLLEDVEFRHAVAGAIGYKEILDRFAKVEEDMNARFLELRKEMNERFAKVEERMEKNQANSNRRFVRIEKEIRDLRQDMQEGFKRHDEEFARIRRDIGEIRRYMERTSLTLEEEARDVIQHRLRNRGISMSISRLELADVEVDIYGVDTELCIIGEVKTRASPNVIEEVDKEIERLCSRYPSYLREKVIKVVYTMQIAEEAVREAEKRKIWVVTATKDLTPLAI
ncbi:hypothetical protein HRbin04_01068 [archaeon HR04]|nr:hypothetical protein HRbin04_01068 [archaeon HR04]